MKNDGQIAEMKAQSQGESEKVSLTIRFDWYRFILAAIIIFTIFTRFYGLAYKPYHHDESLYATYSWYLYEGRGYKYDPMMHGPFMFHINALTFMLFGAGDFTARFTAALFGIALVCCVPLLRREIGKIGTLTAATLFAVSPTYMYFSRFLRHDIYIAFWAFLVVALFMRYISTHRRGYMFGLGAAISLMFCVKENSYIFLFVYVSFLVIMKVFEKLFACEKPAPHVEQASAPRPGFGVWLLNIAISVAIFFGIFYLLYTTFLSYKPGFVDGLYRKSIEYWLHQDKIQRIKGAFTYFCPLAIVYELPLLVIFFSGIVAVLKTRRLSRIVLIASSAIAVPLLVFWHQKLPIEPWDTTFHMTSTMHVVFALYMFILGVSVMCNLLKDGRRFAAFLAYWSWFSILVYSYAGEKVPWLLMHVLMPMILLSSVFMNEFLQSERFRRRRGVYVALITIGLLLFLQASIRLCFFNEANPNERMVYTQTSMDIKKCVDDITYWAGKTGKGYNFPLGVQGESTWPFSWYLRDYKQWFHPGSFTSPGKEIVIADWTKRNDYKNILEPNYKEQRRRLRVWWVPDPVSTLKNPIAAWLKYYFRREPWNPTNRKDFEGNLTATGSQDIVFCVRNDLLGEQLGAGEGMPVEGGPPTPVIPEKYAIIGHVNPALCFGELGSTEGKLNQPRGIWVDEEGMIYVADTKNHRWQKFDQRGNCLITVGREGKEPTEFKEPMGIAVDGEGNIYVADTWNHRIQKFDREGNFIKLWPGGEGGFWAPKGMAFDSQGYLYVVDTGRHRVQKFTREGNPLLVWGDQGEGKGQFKEPVGIVIERDGIVQKADVEKKREQVRGDVVYVTDTANKRVQKFDTNGKFLGEFGVLGWEEYYTEPFIALDGEKRLWLTDSRNNRVEIFDTEGTLLGLWSSKGFRPGDFNIPIGIFIRDDTIYITDTYNNRIQLFPEKLVMK